MKRINTYLADRQIELLKNLAKKTDLTVAELIRRAIDEYLKKIK